MPVMLRPNAKATKIAWRLLGKPANLRAKDAKRKTQVDRRLTFEETTRVR